MKQDKGKLRGTWRAVTARQRGESKDEAAEHRLIFSGDEFSIKRNDETILKGKFKIDPSKKPKEIEMEIAEAAKEQLHGKTVLGIYELDADTLKWCANDPGETERPKEFSGEPGTNHFLVTFKREKSK